MSEGTEPEASWKERELVFEIEGGKGELYVQKNKSEDTRKKIVHIKSLIDREVIGLVERVQYGTFEGRPACLFVARFKFRWDHKAFRFRKVEICFTAANRKGNPPAPGPIVRVYSPKQIYGLWSKEHKEYHFDLKLQCSISAGPVQVQVGEASTGKTTSYDVDHALEITGTDWQDNESDEPNMAIFVVDENKLQDTGVPKEMFFGIVFEHAGDFQVDVRMDVSDFTAWPWSKDDPIILGSAKTLGKAPRTLELDKLTDADWLEIVPYRAEREVTVFGIPKIMNSNANCVQNIILGHTSV